MVRYAITDRARAAVTGSAPEGALLGQAARLAEAGVDFLQLREKDLEPAVLVSLARKMMDVLRAHPVAPRLLINSRADVAVAAGADGVHLSSARGSLTPADIRTLYAAAGLPEPTVSVSCHTLAEVANARDSEASLILFGPVFEKVVAAPNPGVGFVSDGIGLNLLHLACAAAGHVPVLALGGVTEGNAPDCLAAGAAGIAAIRLFLD